MRRVVIDTNVIVSSVLAPTRGHPASIVNAWRGGHFSLVISEEIIEEIKEVLNRFFSMPELRERYRLTRSSIGRLINLFHELGIIVPGTLGLAVIERDPKEDKFIIAAIEGQAEYIVTGDDDLLSLKTYRGIKIISPAEFVKIIS